ncbi:VOC family protein [Pseudidiomarina taiwanensis]|uniref:Glyoxalase n=1 Tax=Pseudidiomarina taiwanensis TaxID=337250 RepID=A0A432ZEW1_9GAMM|nr:VOC family protein [Pseudidiomarina taiwanensis]RUO76496.1 glyoxalase [Pseudidiomarina taiwanensis]
MFSHIMVGANSIEESKKFYDAVLGTLGHGEGTLDEKGRCFYFTDKGIFALTKPINGEEASGGNGLTIGFAARSTDEIDAWHKAGLENGGTDCEEPPGWREGATMKLYLAYLRDPAGNKICALLRG